MTNLASTTGHRTGPLQRSQTTISLTQMAPKAHGVHRSGGGITRTHSRTSSGGGSRLGLNNLQLTQKDAIPPRIPDVAVKPKKAHHLQHETNGKSSAHISRNNSSVRLQTKDHVNPPTVRRASGSTANGKGSSKHKVGFTISSPSEEGDDDDEWISSESGAATPSHESDVEESTTPVEKHKPHFPPNTIISNGFAKDELPTPRAEVPTLPRVELAKPPQERRSVLASQASAGDYETHPSQPIQSQRLPQSASSSQRLDTLSESPTPPLPQSFPGKARSETHSPPRRSPDAGKRSMTRPPSSTSINSSSTHIRRPHPLIRAHSASHGALLGPAKPAPLAPLTTVPADSVPAQMSATSSPTSFRAVSPTFSMHSPVLSQPSPTASEASRQLRRSSTSSRSSVATLPSGQPMQGSASHAQLSRTTNHDRQRTLSSSSTFAALSSLNLGLRSAAPSPPKTPLQQLIVHFPPEQSGALEGIHPLLPPPYLNAHLTVLAHRNPLAESYDRVMRAKQAR